MKWQSYKLKEVGEVVTGNTPPTTQREYYGTQYKFIKPTDMREGQRYVPITEEYYSELAYQKYRKSLLPVNTPCVVTIGSLGKKMCLTDEPSFTNQAVNAVIPNENFDGVFLYYCLRTRLPYVKQLDSGTTSGRENVSKSSFSNIVIEAPSLAIQKKIASILSAYDNLIENNNKRIKILEQMAEDLYKEWFVRFRFPGHETTPLENGIPKGWKVKPLNDWLIDNFNGGWGEEDAIGTKSSPASVIRGTDIEDVKSAIIDNVPLRYHTEKEVSQKSLQVHDIILELSNGNINNIGRTLYIDELLLTHFSSVMCASFCKTLRCKNESDAFYIWLYIQYLQNSGLMNYYKNTGTNGINNFNFKRFLKMKIAMPANCLLKPFVHLYQNIFLLREHNYNLIKQRDLLLPRLMSGKLAI